MGRKRKPFTSRRWKKRLAYTKEKVRNVCCIIFMEDLEASGHTYYDLLEYLASLHMECSCSCVHDSDLWTGPDVASWCEQHIDPLTGDVCLEDMGMHKEGEGEDAHVVLDDADKLANVPYVGKAKKPHVHLLLKGPSQQNAEWWSDLFAGLMEIRPTMWEKCLSVPGLMRYFAHLDDPDKYQYGIFGVQGFGGIDLSPLVKTDEIRKTELHGEVLAFLQANPDMRYFDELVDALTEDLDMSMYVKSTGAYWVSYIQGRNLRRRNKREEAKEAKEKKKNADDD